ncbi:protein of unknown function [Algoriphagus ornithinivorans]|uniref:Uncharacterized protein n=1 Tax=Algoriphagus ornithinivorans TaxID=226506 RepID=A0A1I5AX46_9BACT|nr:DUF4184 family protein [Algoriphagus ornithinivorans]SFN66997.1 protein of unknown function [Algoriphagus ornithinivorans]
MPFTFSHSAAVLPGVSKKRFSQTGLILGSIVPDLEFYFSLRLDENIGHKMIGIFLLDFPLAFLLAFIFHQWVKIPLMNSSPLWIQERVQSYSQLDWKSYFHTNSWKVILSIFLGIGTHLFLDAFTHVDGFMVNLIPALAADLHFASIQIPVYDFLQISLSVIGLVLVAIAFLNLKRIPASPERPELAQEFWALTSMISLIIILIRWSLSPEFTSFWDGFVMLVGAMFYAIFLSSLILKKLGYKFSGSHSKFHKLINTGSFNPGFKSRAFAVEENKFLRIFSKGVMKVNNFIHKAQIIITDFANIQVIPAGRIFKKMGQRFTELFNIASFGFSFQFDFNGGFIQTLHSKFSNRYSHVIQNLREYINSTLLLVAISLIIFLIPLEAKAQNSGVALSPEKREAHIQAASKLRSEEQYFQAISHLDSILNANPVDAQILLFKGDLLLQSQQFAEAVNVYNSLIPLDYETTVARVNMSYALFMDKKPAKALEAAKEAWKKDAENKSAIVNYFNAQLWNIKTQSAGTFLQENQKLLLDDQILVMNARLWTTSGNYKKGLAYYDSLVTRFPQSYYIQEYAEVLIGKKQWEQANQLLALRKDSLSVSQQDKLNDLLDASKKQTAGIEGGYFEDIAGNIRIEQAAFWQNETNSDLQVGLRVGASQVSSAEGQKTKANFFALNLGHRWTQALESKAELVGQQINPDQGESFRGITGKVETTFQPNDRRMFGLYYSSDLLNFTADLLGKNIRSNNLGALAHVMLDGKTGIFSQGSYGMLNDGNTRIQFFGSIYRLIRTEPTLKTGLNFSALSFSDSETNLYFAPEQFMSTELFVDYSSPMPLISKVALKIQAAAGVQKINELNWEPTYRANAELNYRISGFDLGLNGQFSNVAAASGTGYRFHAVTLKVNKKF